MGDPGQPLRRAAGAAARAPAHAVANAAVNAAAAVDSETRVIPSDHQALRLWLRLRLLACTRLIEAPLRRRLRLPFGSSLPRFDLMAQLDRHPGGLKMRELSRRLRVTGGNVTGLTAPLVAEGLVQGQDDATDRRAFTVALTAHGQARFQAMARSHASWMVELLAGLAAGQQAQMLDLLGQLKDSLPVDGRP